MANVDLVVSSNEPGEEPENYTFTLHYPDNQGMAAFRLMQMMGREMEALAADQQTEVMGRFIETMFATGDATLDPTLVYSEDSAREIMEAAQKSAHEATTSTDAEATVETTPGVAVTVGLAYTWPKGRGGRALGALQHVFTEQNIAPFLNELLSSGDGSAMAELLASEPGN